MNMISGATVIHENSVSNYIKNEVNLGSKILMSSLGNYHNSDYRSGLKSMSCARIFRVYFYFHDTFPFVIADYLEEFLF